MRRRLRDIAFVQTGYSFRTRLEAGYQGGIAVIQMKDLNDANIVVCRNLVRVHLPNVKPHHLVRPGDLVFRSRGQSNTAAILEEDPGLAVLAAPLFRIQADRSIVRPEYLAWQINQPASQAYLAARSKGTVLKMIGKQTLENLEVDIPPLERQHAVMKIVILAREEQRLLTRIAERRNHLISARLVRLTREVPPAQARPDAKTAARTVVDEDSGITARGPSGRGGPQ